MSTQCTHAYIQRLYARSACKEMGAGREPFDAENVLRASYSCLRAQRSGEVAACFDARGFADPSNREGAKHCGTHWRVTTSLLDHARWPRFVRWLREKIDEHSDASAAVPGAASAAVPGAECNLRIVFACRAGKHRSVGLAELSRNMLASDPRVHVWQWTHLTPLALRTACRLCEECTSLSDEDRLLRERAVAAYQAALQVQ